jgi:glycosyltransferase involved in cell wall biosynthesis
MLKISIIIPVFNEEKTVGTVLGGLLALSFEKEIIIVDDGSSDKTLEKIEAIKTDNIKVFRHQSNLGKGAALRSGIKMTTGEYIVFCDADLEYDTNQISNLFEYAAINKCQVVYGSRFIKYQPKKNIVHYLGNRFLTWITNLLFGANLTDMETGYKLFQADILKGLVLTSSHFEIEPEITAKILKKGIKIVELSVSYDPRVKSEGKKIKYRDGLIAFWTLIKEKMSG